MVQDTRSERSTEADEIKAFLEESEMTSAHLSKEETRHGDSVRGRGGGGLRWRYAAPLARRWVIYWIRGGCDNFFYRSSRFPSEVSVYEDHELAREIAYLAGTRLDGYFVVVEEGRS